MNWYRNNFNRIAMPMVNKEDLENSGYGIYGFYLSDEKDDVKFVIYNKLDTNKILGQISIAKSNSGKYWYVYGVGAKKGYGPLLYEAAMSFATRDGKSLISHEIATEMGEARGVGVTSPKAKKVWDRFDTREDITKDNVTIDKKTFPAYKLEGDKHRELKIKDHEPPKQYSEEKKKELRERYIYFINLERKNIEEETREFNQSDKTPDKIEWYKEKVSWHQEKIDHFTNLLNNLEFWHQKYMEYWS